MILPRSSVFVNTHVTTSPAESSIALAGDWSEQTAEVSTQFAGTVSETEYVPGSRSPESLDWPSLSENPSAS